MTKENCPSILDKLSSLCDDKSSFQARFALASFSDYSQSSTILEKGMILFEYLQLTSLLLISLIMLNFNPNSALFHSVFLLVRLVNPAFWMSFDKTGALENTLLIFVCIFTVAKLFLFLYVLHKCARSTEISPNCFFTIWKIIMKFQSRIAYFYVSSFYIAAIKVVNWETYQNTNNQSIAFQIATSILMVFELLLALVPKMCYHDMLPAKNFLSAKENTLEITTLVQKVFVQIMTGAVDLSIPANNWIFASLNICIDIFRITNFFIRLPFYNFKALYFQGWLLIMVASLNFSYFISLVIKELGLDSQSLAFSLIIWGVLLCFGVIVSNNFLKKAFWRIICDPSLNSPNLLIHRIVVIKELQKYNDKDFEANPLKNDFELLVWKTLNSHIKRILWTDNDLVVDKKNSNILFKNFLEKIQEKFPHNRLLQLFLAELYFKKMKVYGDSIKICLNLQRSSHSQKVKINAELLLIKIQNQIKHKSKTLNQFHHLDLLNFVSEHAFIAKLKQDMLKQTDLQIKICSEILKDSPDLEFVYQNSQKAHFHRVHIMKKISQISTQISDFHIEPIALSAEYSLYLNHSITDYLHFTQLSQQKLRKYNKLFAQEKLCPETAFQENVGFLKISGAKGEAGKIIYATKQIGNILGGDSSQYPGLSLPERTPPIVRRVYVERWKQLSENPETSSFGKINRSFFFHFDGYLVEIEYFIDIHPFTTQGFAFLFLFRSVVSNRETLLLHENGDIDSASKGLTEKLGLKLQAKKINIRDLNDELAQANEAINITAFPHKYGEKNLKEFQDISSKYLTEGVNITLKSQQNLDMSYSYHCKIKTMTFGSLLVKVLTFEENKRENRTNQQFFSSSASKRKASENYVTQEEMSPEIQSSQITQKTDRDFHTDTPRDTERQLIPSKPRTKKKNNSRLFIHTLKRLDHDDNLARFHSFSEISDEDDEEVIYRKVKPKKNLSQVSQEKKVSSIFQTSLDSKYYSKIFKGLAVGFYLALIILIILKLFAYVASANYMDSLVAKKDIFSNNGYRSYILIETAGMARYVWQFTSGALDMSEYPANLVEGLNCTKTFVINNIESLLEANKILLSASSILSGDEQHAVFQKNVKVYDTYFDASVQSFVMMDSLQATHRIIEAGLAVYYSFFDSTFNPEMITRAQFLFRNSLNDLILKNTQLSNMMLNSVDGQFSDLKALSINFMVIFIVSICVLSGVLIFFFWKQYSSDFFLLSALSRLNVKAIHKELINFQKHLKQQDDHFQQEADNTRKSLKTNISIFKSSDNKSLRKRYLIQTLWIVAILVFLIIIIVINALMVDTRLNKIKSAQEKLYFINGIRIKMSLASTTFRELAATNNTALVDNREALVELELLNEQLVIFRTEIYSKLLTEEIIQDTPHIKTLLLGDACSLLGSVFDSYCQILKQNGMSSGFINLMNEFEEYSREKVQAYKQSDKSAEALAELQAKDFDIRGVIYETSLNEIGLLWTQMNQFFISKIEADEAGRNLSLSVFLVGVIVVGILGWRFLLKGLGENGNQLKNVLRSFPARLVLANFTLKAFLMKTSQADLESIRNEI